MIGRLRDEISGDLMAMMGTVFMRPALARLKKHLDWVEHGAAPLLGVNGV